jgi:hypothetical protein
MEQKPLWNQFSITIGTNLCKKRNSSLYTREQQITSHGTRKIHPRTKAFVKQNFGRKGRNIYE